jgi:tetratricopeptide (TPR) repeat protein
MFWKRRWWLVLALVLVAAHVKIIWEGRLAQLAKQSGLFSGGFNMNLRGKINQDAAIAVLGGFRGIVTDFTWLSAHDDWSNRQWFRMKPKLDMVVMLQPHFIDYWDIGAWHMAWNISYDASVNTAEPREAYRLKEQRYWIDEGEKFLREAIANNPESWLLYFKLGWLLDQKKQDYKQAAEFYAKAAEFADAPTYVRRQVGHALNKAGLKREALEHWRKIWKEPRNTPRNAGELWERIEAWIRELEAELNVPAGERIFPKGSVQKLPEPPPRPVGAGRPAPRQKPAKPAS